MQLLLGYDDEPSNVKAVFGRKKILSPVEMGPKNDGFWENGGRNLRLWFRDPKTHFLARNRVV